MSTIGLPKGMSRDDAYIQGMADGESLAKVYIHLGNALTGAVGFAGPFTFVQLTYNHVIRVEEEGDDTSREVAWFRDGLWEFEEPSLWTDVTVSTVVPTAKSVVGPCSYHDIYRTPVVGCERQGIEVVTTGASPVRAFACDLHIEKYTKHGFVLGGNAS